jgi:hypothetical protein
VQFIFASIKGSLPENTAAGQPPFREQSRGQKISVKNYMSDGITVGLKPGLSSC